MPKKAFVTGTDGFIAKHLIINLLKKNYKVFAGYYKKKPKINNNNIIYLKCNVLSKKQVYRSLEISKPDSIFHLAAKSLPSFSFKYPDKTIDVNLKGTVNILENCRSLKINPKLIIACSSGQYGSRKLKNLPLKEKDIFNPEHVYGLSKVFQQYVAYQYFKMYKMKIISAIIFNTTGPGKKGDVFTDFCKQYVKNKKKKTIDIKVGNLNNYRDFLHVEDLCRALLTLEKRGKIGEAYNVCTSSYIKISQIIRLMELESKKKIKTIVSKKLLRKFDEKYIFGSYSKLKKLGWKPLFNTKKIFKDICEYYEN